MSKVYFSEVSVQKPGDLGPGPWVLRGLKGVTVIFGKNGSGKSRLLRAWRDQDAASNHYIVPERTGDLNYDPGFLAAELEGKGRRETANRNFVNNYRQHIVTRIQAYFTARGDVRGNQLPGNPEDLETALSTLLPDFSIKISGRANPPYALHRASGAVVPNIDALSSGEAQLLTVALDVLTIAAMWDMERRERRLMLIDEPDAHVHPDLQVRFADFIATTAKKYELQVVVATHSTTLLAAIGQFCGEDAGVVYADRTRSELNVTAFSKYKRELAACLGGHALMGPLFGVPLVLVEGDDDYRIWSQVPRHHVVSIAVIPCGGDEIFEYQEDLERLFEALREDRAHPAGYAILDGDKALPQPNATNPQGHVKFKKLACHESENLYLTDDVLALLGKDWTTAATEIVGAASKFGNKEAKLAQAGTWDRKTVDLKGLMVELIEILDPKKVHWTIRVARAIGEKKPEGQLADFLGADLVGTLWP